MMSRPNFLKCALLFLITLTVAFLLYANGVGDVITRSTVGTSSGSAHHTRYSRVRHEISNVVANSVQYSQLYADIQPEQSKIPISHKHTPVKNSLPLRSSDHLDRTEQQTLYSKHAYRTDDSSVEVRCPQPIEPDMILPCNATSDPTCRKYLLPVDYFWLRNTTETFQNMPYGKCRFMNGSRRAPVALASFPGSGNTWVRGLLEQATGICTGSLYHDGSIRAAGMNGEVIRSGTVLVVKTHHRYEQRWTTKRTTEISEKGDPKWSSAIFIVRNLSQALISEWNRHRHDPKYYPEDINVTGHHVQYAGPGAFGNNRAWRIFIRRRGAMWPEYFTNWYLSGRPVLVIRYEDLKLDILRQVRRMLDFLGFPYTENELEKRLSEDFGTFHRPPHADFEHFTPQQKVFVKTVVRRAVRLLRENGSNTLGIEEYL